MKLIAISLVTLFALSATAAPAKLGMCIACHGKNGKGTTDLYPNLKGQKKPYLLKALKDFKSGVRKDPNMKAMTASLSDKDMEALADYYSKQK